MKKNCILSKSKLDRHLNSKIPCTERITTDKVISNSKLKYEDKFEYEGDWGKTEYEHSQTKMDFYCKKMSRVCSATYLKII